MRSSDVGCECGCHSPVPSAALHEPSECPCISPRRVQDDPAARARLAAELEDAGVFLRLVKELQAAEPVRMQMPALEAYTLLAILQLASRHPELSPLQLDLVMKAGRDLQEAIAWRCPFAAETLELGWDPGLDVRREGR